MKNPVLCLGRFICCKSDAKALIFDLFQRFDGTLEASVALAEIEDKLVRAGCLTWDDCEEAERANHFSRAAWDGRG